MDLFAKNNLCRITVSVISCKLRAWSVRLHKSELPTLFLVCRSHPGGTQSPSAPTKRFFNGSEQTWTQKSLFLESREAHWSLHCQIESIYLVGSITSLVSHVPQPLLKPFHLPSNVKSAHMQNFTSESQITMQNFFC
eukprot:c53513_g1_i1 orf=44-454(-)